MLTLRLLYTSRGGAAATPGRIRQCQPGPVRDLVLGDGQGGGSPVVAIHAYYDERGARSDGQKATKELQ